ncbi:leucine-rich repeat-containing protein 19-like [Eucyclogobius newberryi]|uniref:leucine-rich repeat-containing protein 19-like n=1 Tax=Eucyclogobius newberryi TaxID=166745 RepID=UPI003B59FEB3
MMWIMEWASHDLLWVLLTVGIVSSRLDANTPEKVLNLTNRQLQTIPRHQANSTVTTLVLNGNQIALNESDRVALASYSGLSRLYLDYNVVTDIKPKYFTDVPGLKVLALSGNNISTLVPEVFCGLEDLTQLDLSNNSLTSFPGWLLSTLKNLQVLNVDGNPWNCSCDLLHNLTEPQNETLGFAYNATCGSPQNLLGLTLTEAKAKCSLAPTRPKITTILMPPLTTQLNHSLGKGEPTTQGNSWKFTISVAALGLTTAVLILFAIKGPSWYRLFHNYRHRRLQDDTTSGTTVFHQTPRHQQTYTFQEEGGHRRRAQGDEVEDEDGYFEDPYIRREE